jgi:glyoxylase-like metal-dependent hydrolase (beta-lactamase superfamily II)
MLKVEFYPGIISRQETVNQFGSWLAESAGRTFAVDTGVGAGAADLTCRLKERLGDKKLDYILLTHVHLDHAGGVREILKAWPEARVVVHARGLGHLADPARLWEGTRLVMGELADLYGRPEPLNPACLIAHTEANLPGLFSVETPGHASHHLSFRLDGTWFAGEAGGCPYRWSGRLHSRPATPPRYEPGLTLASIDRLLQEADDQAYFAHTPAALPFHEVLNLYKKQLAEWADFMRRPESGTRQGESRPDHLNRLADDLFRLDPNLGPLNSLPSEDLRRERHFMCNSIEGFLEYQKEEARRAGTQEKG